MKSPRASFSPRRPSRLAFVLVAILAAASTVVAADRVIAVGDVHGSIDGLTEILRAADLIDTSNTWIGGDTTLVQTGDLLDRGLHPHEVMDLLMRLQSQAPESGGKVIVLLGNHEVMNLLGIRRDVNPDVYASFVDDRSEERRNDAFKTFQKYWEQRRREQGRDPQLSSEAREQWFAMHPPGYFEYGAALSPSGTYGAWLRGLPIAVVIDHNLFLHGGYGPMLKGLTVEEINARAAEELKTFDEYHDYMVDSGLTLPWFSAPQMAGEIASETNAFEATESEGGEFDRRRLARLEHARGFLQWSHWLIVDPEGPLWFRGAARWDETEHADEMAALLDGLGVDRMVVGHTVQRSNTIEPRFGGRVFPIDTGMLQSVYAGTASALEISGDTVTAIYPHKRQVLEDGTAPPATRSQEQRNQVPVGGG